MFIKVTRFYTNEQNSKSDLYIKFDEILKFEDNYKIYDGTFASFLTFKNGSVVWIKETLAEFLILIDQREKYNKHMETEK